MRLLGACRAPRSARWPRSRASVRCGRTAGPRSKRASPRSRRCFVSFRNDRAGIRPRRGFTLIELLVVIAIIATLAAVVAPSIFRNVGDAKVSAAKSQIELLALALNSYRLDNDVFPSTDQGLEALRT